jgi:hypothetical protein
VIDGGTFPDAIAAVIAGSIIVKMNAHLLEEAGKVIFEI